MFKRFLAIFFAFTAIACGELHNFTLNSISYEWEAQPDFHACKKPFMDALIKCYDQIPLEVLRKQSRADTIQWLSDAFNEFYSDLQKTGSNLRWLTAKEDGKAVGFLLINLDRFPEEIYLAQMAVEPAHQRRGIATAMVFSLIDQLPEAKRLVVITRKANQEARALYRALGFSDSSYIHKGYSRELYCGFEYESPKE